MKEFDFNVLKKLEDDDGFENFADHKSNLTGDDRTEARLCAVQAIYSALLCESDLTDVAEDFKTRLKERNANKQLFTKIFKKSDNFDILFIKNLYNPILKEGWTFDKLDLVTKAILVAAYFEFDFTPSKIVIDEYVKVARGFVNSAEELGFINGTLETLSVKVEQAKNLF